MKAKKKRIILLAVLLSACVIVYIPFAVPWMMQMRLRSVFPGSRISVGTCSVKLSGVVSIEDITINGPGAYEISVEEVAVFLDPLSMARARIPKVVIREPIVLVTLGAKDIQSLSEHIRFGTGGLIKIEHIELFRAHLNITSKDLITESFISADIVPLQRRLETFEVSIDHLRCPGFLLKGLSCYSAQDKDGGRLYIRKVVYNRMRAYDVEGLVSIEDTEYLIEELQGVMFGGKVKGAVRIAFEEAFSYDAQVRLEEVDFLQLVDELGFGKKISASGRLFGDFNIAGELGRLESFNGQLSARAPGGSFMIRDEDFLHRIARSRQQDMQVIMDAFKDYVYARGTVNLRAVDSGLVLEIYLDGDKGKRALTINVHDFF